MHTAQNDYQELWSLLHWANPLKMGAWDQFLEHYVNPMKQGQKRDCTDLQLAKVGFAHAQFFVAVASHLH